MSNSSHTYGVSSKLSKNTFTKAGHTFNGWNTKADGTGTTYTNGQTISNLASTNGEVVTLYAQRLEKTSDNETDNSTTPGYEDNSDSSNSNTDDNPNTGMLTTFLASLIGLGALGGVIYYRKKIKI